MVQQCCCYHTSSKYRYYILHWFALMILCKLWQYLLLAPAEASTCFISHTTVTLTLTSLIKLSKVEIPRNQFGQSQSTHSYRDLGSSILPDKYIVSNRPTSFTGIISYHIMTSSLHLITVSSAHITLPADLPPRPSRLNCWSVPQRGPWRVLSMQTYYS